MSWRELKEANPKLAAFGAERFGSGVAYFATTRKDGSPRVYPVTPIVAEERLFLFMEPTSPKARDLERDGRYAMHSAVSDSEGFSGEFIVFGRANLVDDADKRELVFRVSEFDPEERYVLFELEVENAFSTVYEEDRPVRQRWAATPS